MAINAKKSARVRIGSRFRQHCSTVSTLDGREIRWEESVRYLGVHITSAKAFVCSLANAKKSFYPSTHPYVTPIHSNNSIHSIHSIHSFHPFINWFTLFAFTLFAEDKWLQAHYRPSPIADRAKLEIYITSLTYLTYLLIAVATRMRA